MSTVIPPLFFVDRSGRGRVRLTGKDRQSFLQGMVTNDVARLAPGQGCYAFLLDATGHVLADVRILCLEDSLLLDVEPGMAPFVAETLDRYLIMEKVRIADVTSETRQILIGGIGASEYLKKLGVDGAEDWAEGQNAAVEIGGASVTVAATRLLPVPAFDIYWTAAADAALLNREGISAGAIELPAETADALRIEAGVPKFGVDMDSRVLAPETAQQKRAIAYRKGCYIGQEIVARIDARGHTNRTFAGFRLAPGAALPAPETPVLAADGREAGRITSAALSPTLGVPLALGYIRHEYAEPGTTVTVDGQPAMVTALPFVASDAGTAAAALASTRP